MPTFQRRLLSLQIVEVNDSAVFLLTFESGAIVVYQCPVENFGLSPSTDPNVIRRILRTSRRNNGNDDDDDEDDD